MNEGKLELMLQDVINRLSRIESHINETEGCKPTQQHPAKKFTDTCDELVAIEKAMRSGDRRSIDKVFDQVNGLC